MFARAFDNEFVREVRTGLTRNGQKTLPCRYFYDDIGSALFETITRLPEYGLSRADARIVEAHAAELVAALPRNLIVTELGSGSGSKTRPILEAVAERQLAVYYPIDVSAAALKLCEQELGTIAAVVPLEAGYLDGLRRVVGQRDQRAAAPRPLPRQHHRQLRARRRDRFSARHPHLPGAGRRPAARHRPGEAGRAHCSKPTTIPPA